MPELCCFFFRGSETSLQRREHFPVLPRCGDKTITETCQNCVGEWVEVSFCSDGSPKEEVYWRIIMEADSRGLKCATDLLEVKLTSCPHVDCVREWQRENDSCVWNTITEPEGNGAKCVDQGTPPQPYTTDQYVQVHQDKGNKAVCDESFRIDVDCGGLWGTVCGPYWGDLNKCKKLCTDTPGCNYLTFFGDNGCRIYRDCHKNTMWDHMYPPETSSFKKRTCPAENFEVAGASMRTVTWAIGPASQSCTGFCNSLEKVCDGSALTALEDASETVWAEKYLEAGITCNSWRKDCETNNECAQWGVPTEVVMAAGGTECSRGQTTYKDVADCGTVPASLHRRLCPCGPKNDKPNANVCSNTNIKMVQGTNVLWTIGTVGESCTTSCQARGKMCVEKQLCALETAPTAQWVKRYQDAGINTCDDSSDNDCSAEANKANGYDCASLGFPKVYINPTTAESFCWFPHRSNNNRNVVAPCAGEPNEGTHRRLCPCGDLHRKNDRRSLEEIVPAAEHLAKERRRKSAFSAAKERRTTAKERQRRSERTTTAPAQERRTTTGPAKERRTTTAPPQEQRTTTAPPQERRTTTAPAQEQRTTAPVVSPPRRATITAPSGSTAEKTQTIFSFLTVDPGSSTLRDLEYASLFLSPQHVWLASLGFSAPMGSAVMPKTEVSIDHTGSG